MPQYNPQALSEFKRANLDSKIADKQLSSVAKINSIFGPSEAELALNADVANLRQLAQQEYQAKVQREDEAVLSDEAVDSPLGYAANLGLNLTSKVADVAIGMPARLGVNLADAYDDATIPTEDKARFKTINDKREAGSKLNAQLKEMAAQPPGTYTSAQIDEVRAQFDSTQLTEEEELFSDPNQQRTSQGTGSFKRLKEGEAREEIREVLTQPFTQLEKWVNKGSKDKAVARVRDEVERAAVEIDEGNYGEATGTILASIKNLVTQDTGAATELLVDSVAHMVALAKNAPVAIATIGSDMLAASTKEFEEEHKRPAEPEEMAYMALLVYGSVGLDAIGAKVSFGAATGFRSVLNIGSKLGIELPKSLKDIAGKLSKVTGTAPVKVVKATAVEGVTEAAQEILEGQAVKQDISKIDGKQAAVAGVIGAAIGGAISVPSSTVSAVKDITKGADKVRKTVHKVATKAKVSLVDRGIGTTDKIIARAKKNNKPELGIKEIQRVPFSDIPVEKQDEYLDKFEEFINQYADDVNVDTTKLVKYETDLNTLYDKVIESRATPVKETVDTLTNKDASPEQAKEAAENLASHVRNSATVSPVDVKRGLGSDSSFRENATPEEVKVVEDLNDFQEAVVVARNIDNVTDNVLKGSKGSKFVGVETHMSNAKTAIRKGDTEAVTTVLSKLNNFLASQKAKLDIKTHSPKFITQIENEVNLIEATIQQITTLAEAQPKAKPEVEAKAEVKAEPKKAITVKDLFEYKDGKPVNKKENIATLSAEMRKGLNKKEVEAMRVEYNKILAEIADIQYAALSEINITREVVEEDTDTVTFNAAQEYATLTKRIQGLNKIWKECK